MTETRTVAVVDLTAKRFASFGTVIVPVNDGTIFGGQDAALHFGGGTRRFYAMRLPNRGLIVSRITRHRDVTQVLAAAGGRPWLLAVAPPPVPDTAEAEPKLDDIRAFRIPGDAAVMLFRGTWHAGPLFEEAEASFFNLELSDTNVADHWTCDLVKRYGVALKLSL
jgi:ureidoglycolate lyase